MVFYCSSFSKVVKFPFLLVLIIDFVFIDYLFSVQLANCIPSITIILLRQLSLHSMLLFFCLCNIAESAEIIIKIVKYMDRRFGAAIFFVPQNCNYLR